MSKGCVCVGGGVNFFVLKRSTFVCMCVSFFPLLMMIRDAPKSVCVGSGLPPRLQLTPGANESMVSLVLRQYMRGENGTEFSGGGGGGFLSCLFE